MSLLEDSIHSMEMECFIQLLFRMALQDYRNRFIQTDGFQVEQKFKKSKWAGLMERPGTSELPGWGAQGCLKDTSSTDVVVHNGKGPYNLLSMW